MTHKDNDLFLFLAFCFLSFIGSSFTINRESVIGGKVRQTEMIDKEPEETHLPLAILFHITMYNLKCSYNLTHK